ncbi:TldD protein [Hydrogenispora ethanolica]|uniref:TldD protein n=1 Tax=Hydrogenispora ethanolica TaxID=1082276 RepID=A0A4R1QKP5_HYDET|nr:TldD/PmbA family protein [Hydrogenispora ethanolica]TCL53737.1 TldD protein [Hydrogenispora ethanolica]
MRVEGSEFLRGAKSDLEKLVGELAQYFQYVSILATDSWGKRYGVQKSGVQVEESRWTERGFVARVFNGRNYSEYSFNQLQPVADMVDAVREAAERSLRRMTQAGAPVARLPLIEETETEGSFHGEVGILPGRMSVADKLARLAEIRDQAFAQSERLVDFRAIYEEVQVAKVFLSQRKQLEQAYVWSQGYLFPIVRRDGRTKRAFRAFSGLKGPELLEEMAGAVPASIQLAESLLDAAAVPPGEYEVICAPEVVGLIAHEAFGHGVEMDMFVKKRAKAEEYLGQAVASPLVTMHDGAAAACHVSSYWFDDEGTPAGDTIIIDAGILRTGISDLLSALRLGTPPTGNGKRESFERKAYARMTNTFFAPGNDRLEEMIASIRHGYLLDGAESGMEDPKNWGIQCMVLRGQEIRDGRLTGKLVSPVLMTGYVPDLLRSISMVSGEVRLFGSGACGKGHKEWAKVSDGGPYIKAKARLG